MSWFQLESNIYILCILLQRQTFSSLQRCLVGPDYSSHSPVLSLLRVESLCPVGSRSSWALLLDALPCMHCAAVVRSVSVRTCSPRSCNRRAPNITYSIMESWQRTWSIWTSAQIRQIAPLLHVWNAMLTDDMLEMIIYCAGQAFADVCAETRRQFFVFPPLSSRGQSSPAQMKNIPAETHQPVPIR